ncbi:uncharacterized protein LOC110989763 [Acanthaster planci]|uniref:Uncharacterized protein LOC110989763 n=1 Tax=Acanthaster planci TaxID=133434 RepID=A0A8B7ZZB7_ACAPL|nr:uncharacterized protein LOC110989763 [Acanthaster planci]
MMHEIAQSEQVTRISFSLCKSWRGCPMAVVSTSEENLSFHEEVAAESVPIAECDKVSGEARKRRHRRGRTRHRHRLSKHRRDQQRARCLKRVMGAPRNDNEYLMSQYAQGQLQEVPFYESHPPPHQFNHPACQCPGLSLQSCLSSLGMEDITPQRGSPDTCSSSPSDYSSLPSSPDEDSCHYGYRDLYPASYKQPERTDHAEVEIGHGIIIGGADADFVKRNFEEEYANNITRGLEEASKEELILKCIALMKKLRELEQGKVSRVAENHVLRSEHMFC